MPIRLPGRAKALGFTTREGYSGITVAHLTSLSLAPLPSWNLATAHGAYEDASSPNGPGVAKG